VIEASSDFKSVNKLDKNRKMMEYMIGTIDQYVDDPRRQPHNRNMNFLRRTISLTCFMFGKFLGNYLVILYLFIKVLYIVNCVGQLFLISVLLGRNYALYGMSIFRDIIQGKGYADSEYFPRVTMCKFQVRELGLKNYSHEYNVQCVLPINLFNQQIFTFLWFWYLLLLIINTSALFIWIYRFVPRNQYNYAIRRVKLLKIRLMESAKLPRNAAEADKANSEASQRRGAANSTHRTNMHVSNEYRGHGGGYNPNNYNNDWFQRDPYATFRNTLLNTARSSTGAAGGEPFNATGEDIYVENLSSMFPNIPPAFNYHVSTIPRPRRRGTTGSTTSNESRAGAETTQSNNEQQQQQQSRSHSLGGLKNEEYETRDYSVINEYETYMTAESFSVKNYKSFVHDYLEADGSCFFFSFLFLESPRIRFI
jgi:hypothetical protein